MYTQPSIVSKSSYVNGKLHTPWLSHPGSKTLNTSDACYRQRQHPGHLTQETVCLCWNQVKTFLLIHPNVRAE